MDRRSFIRLGAYGTPDAAVGLHNLDFALPAAHAATGPYGGSQPADARGIRLPSPSLVSGAIFYIPPLVALVLAGVAFARAARSHRPRSQAASL